MRNGRMCFRLHDYKIEGFYNYEKREQFTGVLNQVKYQVSKLWGL